MNNDELLEQISKVITAKLDEKLEPINGRLDGIEKRLNGTDKRLDGIEKRLDGIENDIKTLKKNNRKLQKGQEQILNFLDRQDTRLFKRVERIEDHLHLPPFPIAE